MTNGVWKFLVARIELQHVVVCLVLNFQNWSCYWNKTKHWKFQCFLFSRTISEIFSNFHQTCGFSNSYLESNDRLTDFLKNIFRTFHRSHPSLFSFFQYNLSSVENLAQVGWAPRIWLFPPENGSWSARFPRSYTRVTRTQK